MNKLMKKISAILMIILLMYSGVGCQSNTDNIQSSDQVVKDYESQVSESGNVNTSDAELHFIDTGNSDAILIIQDGEAALIDGGDNGDGELVVSYIKEQGVSELKYIFATHPHADHIGGLDTVIRELEVGQLYVSNGDADTKTYRDFIQAAADRGLYPSVPLLGSEFELGNSVFEVISVANTNDLNNNSLVLMYKNGNDRVLLMGDAEKEIERDLDPGNVDLLKVGHHGSHSSSTEEFIDRITPEYGVILVGENNRYGHPHQETMDTLKSRNIEIHRSDECGHIVFISTGDGLLVDCEAGSYNSGDNSNEGNSNNNVGSSSEDKDENNTQNDNQHNDIETVYWSTSGNRYHSDPNCSGMNSPASGTIEESKREACGRCY